MSHKQSRGERSESVQHMNQSKSFKEPNDSDNNVAGGKMGDSAPYVNATANNQNVAQNIQKDSALQQQPSHGEPGTNAPRGHPCAVSIASSETSTQTTPAEASGDPSRPVTLPLGSMSLNVANGMHAQHEASGNSQFLPTSSIHEQHFPKLDVGTEGLSTTVESRSISKLQADEQKFGIPRTERDLGVAGNIMGYRPGPGGNSGVVRGDTHAQMQYRNPVPLPGVRHPPGPHGAPQRNNSNSDRWRHRNNFQKGLMPQAPPPIIHRSKNKYLASKGEEAKQRQFRSILNKLTPQNFEKLFEQVKQVNIDNDVTLTGAVVQIFESALMGPTYCEMYANFCYHLAAELPDLSVGNEKITFKRLLLNKCQEEFERGEREQEEANKVEEEGEVKQSEEERESKRLQARRRMLGNIRLLGELYKKRMLTERIMHECIKKLLGGPGQIPDEEDLEGLCILMTTIGEMIDHLKAKEYMDVYFDMMAKLSTNMRLSSRVRFMLLDAIDLRKNKWQQRRKVEGPKKIDEVHRDAALERIAQEYGLATGFSSPRPLMSGRRLMASHHHGFGGQDASFEDRHPRRGMPYRGPSAQSMALSDDSRRMGTWLNDFSATPDRAVYGSREGLMPKSTQERFDTQSMYDQPSTQDQTLDH